MSEDRKRPYVSSLREQQARATRRHIVATAGRLFATQGFAATTVEAIAAEAGVSRKTVFASVGGKVALLKLAYDYALAGDDEPVPLVERDELRTIIAEADPRRQIDMFATFVAGMGERIAALWLALRGAAEVDAEARTLYRRWEDQRLESMLQGPIADFHAKGALRPDRTPEQGAAVLWVLTDPALYAQLVTVGGWSHDQFRSWLAEMFRSQILPPAEPSAG